MNKIFSIISTCFIFISSLSGKTFELTTSHPSHPNFRQNFLGLYGVNTDIEPQITNKEKPIYQKVIPHLQSDPDQAIKILQEQAYEKSSAAFDYLLGLLYYQKDDFKNSIYWLDQSILKFENFRRAIYLKAMILIQEENYKQAPIELIKVIKLGGGDGQIYGLLAYAYLSQEKYASALEAYQKARMFKPENIDFKMGIAQCHLQLQNYRKAIGFFEELINEKPGDKKLWLSQSNAFLNNEQYQEAIANLEILRSLEKADFNSLIQLTKLYLNEDIESLSSSTFIQSLDYLKTPAQGEIILKTFNLFISNQWFDVCEKILQKLPSHFIQNLSIQEQISWDLAQVSLDLGLNRTEIAYQNLKTILTNDPLNGIALILLGDYYKNENRLEEAIFQYERATHLDKHKYRAYLNLGQTNVIKGDFGSALKSLYKAQQIQPGKYLLDYIQQVEKAYRSQL